MIKSKIRFLSASVLAVVSVLPASNVIAGSFFDRARVTNVEPVTTQVRINKPRTECWEERVRIESRHGHQGKKTATPEILGAIIGSAVGHQFGSGRGQTAATIAGAVLGGSIGHDLERRHHGHHHHKHKPRYRTEQRCETVDHFEYEQRVTGYRVTWRYQGHRYSSHMDHHPGKTIRVRVGVTPVS